MFTSYLAREEEVLNAMRSISPCILSILFYELTILCFEGDKEEALRNILVR